ncbi:hypothetical protein [uncultured Parasphingorhabdus sp.]|uniref:hypothetical protein n=1 Tax=uncultured Parasphingorhabdus sp. TaxID=2709694 RepID=UPI0030D901E9|tara:strand:- start:5088 stop:5348 length:261 start_codon:yes stop_codon:yes gene_type:complete
MDSLLLIFLLLGSTPGVSSDELASPRARAQAVASATILRGEEIHLGKLASRVAAKDSNNIFQIATILSAGKTAGVGGRTIELQEFH